MLAGDPASCRQFVRPVGQSYGGYWNNSALTNCVRLNTHENEYNSCHSQLRMCYWSRLRHDALKKAAAGVALLSATVGLGAGREWACCACPAQLKG